MTFARPLEPWRRTLYVIWLAQFIAMVGMSLVVPFLPFYIRDLGVTREEDVALWSGIVFSGPFLFSFFLTPIWGYLGDRYGRKLMVVRAIFGLAISQALIGFSQSVEMLLFFRMLQGAISGFIASALALVSATTPSEKSGYAISILQAAIASGNVVGPLLGGTLADAMGYRPVFFIVAGFCTVAGILVVTLVHEERQPSPRGAARTSLVGNFRYAYRSRSIRHALMTIFLAQMGVLMLQPIFALYVEMLEPNEAYLATIAGAVFAVPGLFMVIGSPWWGQRNDKKSYKKNLTLALSGTAAAYIAQGFCTDVFQLIPFRALQGFCMAGMLPALFSYVSKNTALIRRGGVMGIASSFQVLANMIGPTGGGLVAAGLGLRETCFIAGGVLLVTVVYLRVFFVDLLGAGPAGEPPQPGLPREALSGTGS